MKVLLSVFLGKFSKNMLKKVFKQIIFVYLILTFPIGEGLFAQKITRGPYLQQLGQNSVIIRWRTDVPTKSLVTFFSEAS